MYERDIIAEGFDPRQEGSSFEWFATMWNKMHKEQPWSTNPWVYAITFRNLTQQEAIRKRLEYSRPVTKVNAEA